MKRIVQLGGMLIALGMLFASCQMETSDSSVSGYSADQKSSNINSITIGVGSIDNSRTILPADWDEDTASKLTYVLTGGKTTGTIFTDELAVFSYDELKSKKATVNLEMVTWKLTLTGYIAKDPVEGKPQYDDTKPCLVAADETFNLSTGTKAITFNLKPVTTGTSATGSVNVSISWLTTQPKRIEFGIFPKDTTTEAIVKGTASASYSDSKKGDAFSGASEAASHTENWSEEGIPVDMYKFAAVFYNAETGGSVIGYYIDWLYVDGGNVSKATINYGDKFNTIPENPSWLAVETAFIPQEGTSSTTPNAEYYAKFHWNDRSNNETGFELVITEEGTTEPYVVNPETLDTTLHSDYLLDGETRTSATNNNLDAGTTSVVLKLKTGKKYTAKVRAINDFTPPNTSPDAKFCKTLTRNGDSRNANFAPFVTTGTGETATYEFGMFTVNYALEGGKVIPKKDATSTASGITNYIVGYNYSSEEQNLMTGSIEEYPHISGDDGQLLIDWDDGSDHLTVTPANSMAPMNLKAHWSGVDLYVSVTFPSYANARQVKIASGQNDESTVTFDLVQQSSITVNAGTSLGDDTTFVLTDSKGEVVATGLGGSGKEWIWNNDTTNPIKAGIYCLQITGTYKDTQGSGRDLKLCGNIYINVTN